MLKSAVLDSASVIRTGNTVLSLKLQQNINDCITGGNVLIRYLMMKIGCLRQVSHAYLNRNRLKSSRKWPLPHFYLRYSPSEA